MIASRRPRSYRGGPYPCGREADDAVERDALALLEQRAAWESLADERGLDEASMLAEIRAIAGTRDDAALDEDDGLADLVHRPREREPHGPRAPMTLERELAIEAGGTSVSRSRHHLDLLVSAARPLALWAESVDVCSVRVRARLGVLLAYDRLHTAQISQTLTATPRPLLWWWGDVVRDGRRRRRQRCWPTPDGDYRPAILPRDFDLVTSLEASLSCTHLVEPTWTGTRTHLCHFDAVRPPLLAVALAAKIIEGSSGRHGDVLAVDLGHSWGAQALSIALRRSRVWTASTTYDPSRSPWVEGAGRRPPETVDAVVLGVPDDVAVEYTALATDEDHALSRVVLDELWARPRIEPTRHLARSVELATSRLRRGGIVVVLGDAASGATHEVDDMLAAMGLELEEHGGHSHRSVGYSTPPWAPYGALRPTGRVVSAWRVPS